MNYFVFWDEPKSERDQLGLWQKRLSQVVSNKEGAFMMVEATAARESGVIHIKAAVESCQGCRTCESVCSLFHTGSINPTTTGIKVAQPTVGVYAVTVCQQCFDAPCAKACPADALIYNEYSCVYEVSDACIGCGTCARACPYGAITMSDSASGSVRAYKCDFCGGVPQCIKACPRQVLSW